MLIQFVAKLSGRESEHGVGSLFAGENYILAVWERGINRFKYSHQTRARARVRFVTITAAVDGRFRVRSNERLFVITRLLRT